MRSVGCTSFLRIADRCFDRHDDGQVMTPSSEQFDAFDPFDLPDWLGTADVVWSADGELRGAPRVHGVLRPSAPESAPESVPASAPESARASGPDGDESPRQTLDLLAVDAAYPRTLCPNKRRHDAHQAWHYGEVLLMLVDGRLVAAVPRR